MEPRPNYITPAGYAALRREYDQLFATERPALVETIAWAAGNGDRSENGDYIYGRKRLREIDRRLGWLSKRMKAAKVVDPCAQQDRTRAWFGATVTIADEDDRERTLTLVGDDEADAGAGRIGWNAPLAHALRGAAVGDLRRVALPAGDREYEVVFLSYPERPPSPGRMGEEGEVIMAENPRTTAARDHDDHEMIDAAVAEADTDAVAGSAGGALQTDVGSQADLTRAVDDPAAMTRPEKADDIANDQSYDSDRRGQNG